MPDNFFDKYDAYSRGGSLYCYPGTDILKNKLGITDPEIFRQAESDLAFAALLELALCPIKGNFDRAHLCAVHEFLFEAFYDFAGKTRKENISKGNTRFCVWQYIDEQLDLLFGKIKNMGRPNDKEEIADFLSYIMTELNVIHPFREGNGRAIREFIREYAADFGYKLDWSKVKKEELLDASIASVLDRTNLTLCLEQCLIK